MSHRSTLLLAAAILGMAPLLAPNAANALSARELAGPGQGFRDPQLSREAPSSRGPVSGGILGSLSGSGTSAAPATPGTFRMRPVPDTLSGAGSTGSGTVLPRSPRMQVAPIAVPTPRLRPVPDRLPTTAPLAVPRQGPSGPDPRPMGPDAADDDPSGATTPLEPDGEEPTLIRADVLQHEPDLNTYTARGNVELSTGERVVMADMVAYNEQTDTFTANGNVRVVEEDGTSYFANYLELSSDFKDGFIRDISILLQDRSRIRSVYATRTNGERKDFYKGVYTACDTCRPESSSMPTLSGNQAGTRERARPLWQLRSKHTTHDEVARDLIYRDAVLEVFGVPVFYTPYMRTPDPTVYRRTGLLPLAYRNSNVTGYSLDAPYYIVIDDHQDATLTPRVSTEGDYLLMPEYRIAFQDGEFFADGSLGWDSEMELSGDIRANGVWHINPIWRAGFDAEYYSSHEYMERHSFNPPSWLVNRGYVEAFHDRSYATAEAVAYTRGKVSPVGEHTDLVLPYMLYDHVGQPTVLGGSPLLHASVQGIQRNNGLLSYRGSAELGWTRTGLLPGGLVYDLDARLGGDVYLIRSANDDDDPTTTNTDSFDGALVRGAPSARVGLRYPFIRRDRAGSQIIEPIVAVSMMPPGLNDDRIPNQDSQAPELNLGNLYSGDRTAGRDLLDDGISANYGLRWTYVADSGPSVSVELGQSYRLFDNGFFDSARGYGDGFSDYVGRIDFRPHPWLDASYQVRLDREDFTPVTNVVGFSAGPEALRFSGRYVQDTPATNEEGDQLDERDQITGDVMAKIGQYWRTRLGGTYDFAESRTVGLNGGLIYEDECFVAALRYNKDFNEGSDGEANQDIVLTFTFKTLGSIGLGGGSDEED